MATLAFATFAFVPNSVSASNNVRPAHDECEESYSPLSDDDCPPPAPDPVVSGSVKSACVDAQSVIEVTVESDSVGFATIHTSYGDEDLGDVGVGSNTFHLQVDPDTYSVTVTVFINSVGYNVVEEEQLVVTACEPPPTDVCPNIDGNQAAVPDGMVKDDTGNCVTPPATTEPTTTVSSTLPHTGSKAAGTSALLSVAALGFGTILIWITRRRRPATSS